MTLNAKQKKLLKISKIFKERITVYSKRLYKLPDKIELPKQHLEIQYTQEDIVKKYKEIIARNENKKNEQAINIEKIAVYDTYSVAEKVKDIFIDAKIPLHDRDTWPIVVDSCDNIIWIPGIKKSKFTKSKTEKCDIILRYL